MEVGKKKATSKDQKVTKVNKVFKGEMELKDQQDVTGKMF